MPSAFEPTYKFLEVMKAHMCAEKAGQTSEKVKCIMLAFSASKEGFKTKHLGRINI
jgi:hypothetical protein